jgi:transcriptional regulator with XRE-family HTH domain
MGAIITESDWYVKRGLSSFRSFRPENGRLDPSGRLRPATMQCRARHHDPEGTHVAEIQGALGQRLRELRQGRQLSLKQVAEATGISASFLSQVETGRNDITINRLTRLMRFYGVGLRQLVPDLATPDATIVRHDERPHLSFPSEGVEVFLLTPDTNRTFAPAISLLAPGSRPHGISSHPGQEFILVLEGVVRFELHESPPALLEAGDSAYYESSAPHTIENVGDAVARVLFVSCPPNV